MIRKILFLAAIAPVLVFTFAPSAQTKTTKPKAGVRTLSDTPLARMTRKANEIGFGLVRTSPGNTVFSPSGLIHSFGPVALAAGGKTRHTLSENFGLPDDDAALAAALTAYIGDANEDKDRYTSRTGFLLNEHFPPFEEYRAKMNSLPASDLISTKVAAGFFSGLFGDAPSGFKEASVAIADWLNENSRMSLSPAEAALLIPRAKGKDDTWVFTALNANYFKSDWQIRFKKDKTHADNFYHSEKPIRIEMMEEESDGLIAGEMPWLGAKPKPASYDARPGRGWVTEEEEFAKRQSWPRHQYLRLRFADKRRSMIILLPLWDKAAGQTPIAALTAMEEKLRGDVLTETLENILDDETTALVHVKLPKFSFRTSHELLGADPAAGAKGAFSLDTPDLVNPNLTDFSKLSPAITGEWIQNKNIVLGRISQICEIEVNEEGAKAASVTAVSGVSIGCSAGMPNIPIEFIADHPFLFLIIDDKTGAVLFLGKVTDPSVLKK